MSCPDITTLEQAETHIPSSVLPVVGLRRGENGALTDDAKQSVMDSLKSRGVDPTDPETQKKMIEDLNKLICVVNKQYQFLLAVLSKSVADGEKKDDEFINKIILKNLFMLDILTISRHIMAMKKYDGSGSFIEGWQNSGTSTTVNTAAMTQLEREREMLKSTDLRKHMVQISGEKNNVASNYLAIYGFLNLIAVGLILYVAGAGSN
jgi:hypothetical protein